ncbi:PREDICTED: C-C motif chemokine 8-like [Chinchilla lanigera]|uniref:C-C motif chemokine n=1 Tax=Chinchilla lanigera TaxID=34839 RepID=A0A8C2V3L3_CHILA|nr:PREDICTED: C-C motif chemokine 8-like [Chinchilla lanigera]
MQVSASLLCLLLTAAAVSIQVLAQADMKHIEETPLACCFTFTRNRIPLRLLRDYQLTSNMCSQQAVIFKTRANRQICADPNQMWVQKAVNYLNSS